MRGMTLIVKTIARLLAGPIFLYGVYIVLHGHLTPGGGFAGGVIIAGSFILLLLAFGSSKAFAEENKMRASIGECLGIFIFWLLAMLGTFVGAPFFLNLLGKGEPFNLFSAGIIPLCNIGIGIEVGAALFAILITLAVLRVGDKE